MRRIKLKRVISYPRLHACLFDLGNATPRKHGGAGFSIAGLPAIVDACPSSRMDLVYLVEVDRSTRTAISAAIRGLGRARPGLAAQVRIVSVPPQHVGLGSKTAIILAVLKAIDLECSLRLTKSEMQFLSGRGGTSGVGINVFFTGGFVVDGGHDSRVCHGFLPSRYRHPREIPPATYRAGVPESWRFHLLLAPGKLIQGIEERKFFEKNTPIPHREVFQTIALAYHGLVPAFARGDLKLLRDILDSVHKIGFKRRELGGQSSVVRSIVRSLRRRDDCAVGLSSMGPLVYAVSNADNRELREFVESLSRSTGARMLGTFAGRNLGYRKQ
jgi:beta-ribofuranosylaminobenzene 5'-phosphate synthase